MTKLQGMRVGVQGPPLTVYYVAAQLYPKYFGVNYTLVTYSSITLENDAFEAGQIAAEVATSASQVLPFQQAGLGDFVVTPSAITPTVISSMIADVGYPAPAGGEILGSMLITTPSYIRQHSAVVQGMVNALTEAQLWINDHNTTQVLNVMYQDPITNGENESSLAADMPYQKAYTASSFVISGADWTATVDFVLATNPALQGNSTKILSTFNTLYNDTFGSRASWCLSNASLW